MIQELYVFLWLPFSAHGQGMSLASMGWDPRYEIKIWCFLLRASLALTKLIRDPLHDTYWIDSIMHSVMAVAENSKLNLQKSDGKYIDYISPYKLRSHYEVMISTRLYIVGLCVTAGFPTRRAPLCVLATFSCCQSVRLLNKRLIWGWWLGDHMASQ